MQIVRRVVRVVEFPVFPDQFIAGGFRFIWTEALDGLCYHFRTNKYTIRWEREITPCRNAKKTMQQYVDWFKGDGFVEME